MFVALFEVLPALGGTKDAKASYKLDGGAQEDIAVCECIHQHRAWLSGYAADASI